MRRARPTVLLTVLAAVLSFAALQWAGWLGLERGEPVTVPAAAAPSAVRPGHPGAHPGDRIASLNVAALAGAYSGGLGGRDPWRFVDPPPVRRTDTSSKAAPPQAQVAAAPAEPPLPHPEDFTLRYLGRFGPPEKKIAVFTDGRRVLDRQEGEVLDGKFIVSRIGYESV